MRLVVTQLVFNVHALRVELVLLGTLCRRKCCIVAHCHTSKEQRHPSRHDNSQHDTAPSCDDEGSRRPRNLRASASPREITVRTKSHPAQIRPGDRLACMKKSACLSHALCRSPTTGLIRCMSRQCAQSGASLLTCRLIDE